MRFYNMTRHRKFMLVIVTWLISAAGCGVIGVLTTPTSSEKFFKAEYDIAEHANGKILVVVEQENWGMAEANFGLYLTEYFNEALRQYAKVKERYLVGYSDLLRFQASCAGFSQLSPARKGALYGADKVLLVVVEGQQLSEQADSGYYEGYLNTRSFVFDVNSGLIVWPGSAEGKRISVGIESERGADDTAVRRLARSTAYCVVRYLYNCPKDKFRNSDERIAEIGYW
ncbi:MAG: hypothetical protein ABIG61_09320 [Planctomycetota bacterium]